MKSIYDELLDRVANGERFRIDLKNKSLKVGNKHLILKGYWNIERPLIVNTEFVLRECLSIIEVLYERYRTSTPSERSDKKKNYFYALPESKMTTEQLIIGMSREQAQAALEGFILCSVLNGDLYWNEELMGKWYWKSKIHPDLIILRDWIEQE